MHAIKFEHFARDNPGVPLPAITPVASSEARTLELRLAERLFGDSRLCELQLLKRIFAASTRAAAPNAAEAEGFSVAAILKGIPRSTKLFVNWYRFDEVDTVTLDDLDRYFDDIWYPSSDDIEIFDTSCEWILSVTHYGDVLMLGTLPSAGSSD